MRLKSPISYYGGKSLMISTLEPLIPQHKTYFLRNNRLQLKYFIIETKKTKTKIVSTNKTEIILRNYKTENTLFTL